MHKKPVQPQPELQPHNPNITTTSQEDYNRFLNEPTEVEMSDLLNEPTYTETQTLTMAGLRISWQASSPKCFQGKDFEFLINKLGMKNMSPETLKSLAEENKE
ncbi:hypothetical protein Tco_0841018 [Tanacetum coccineum]|uniref:Uncharacterized protein n=1 Tax=Tanacetum coccineum TaxID=301880 RepID=A0ABQ5AZH5_9ASTR